MISVIIPYKNAEEFIERCVDSLKAQTGDAEFIMVNDHSTDKGRELIKADSRFVLLDNEHKRGVSGARNTGIDHAKGEYITFLDVDDEMMPGAIAALEAVSRTKANIHQVNHMRYYTAIDKLVMKYANQGGWYDLKNPPVCWWGVWNKLLRADFLKDIRFKEGLQYGEDGLFILECLAKDGRIHHAPKHITTVKHRFDNKQSLSHIKKDKDIIKQVKAYEDFLLRQTDPAVKLFVVKELGRLWTSKSFERTLGGTDEV